MHFAEIVANQQKQQILTMDFQMKFLLYKKPLRAIRQKIDGQIPRQRFDRFFNMVQNVAENITVFYGSWKKITPF